jgi:hypothetical protein
MFEIKTYGVVERALVHAHSVPEDDVSAFRAKLTSLQKQGLFGKKHMPGKGVALAYGPDQFHRLVFAAELFQLGISPRTVLAMVEGLWDRKIRQIFRAAETAAMQSPGDDDIIVYMAGVSLMTSTWSAALPNINFCTLKELPRHADFWMKTQEDDPTHLPPRVIVANLAQRLRRFHNALSDSYTDALRAERVSTSASRGTAGGTSRRGRKGR